MDKIRVWTRQDERILGAIEKYGYHHVDKSYIEDRYEDCSDLYLHVYHWFSREANKVVPRPEGVDYPIWLTVDPLIKLNPVKGQVLLELEIERKDVIIMDAAKWDYILNYWYIPKSENDHRKYIEELAYRGIKDQTAMYMGNFHPLLKRRVVESWNRLFDNSIKLSNLTQGAIWEIRKEWIVNIIKA